MVTRFIAVLLALVMSWSGSMVPEQAVASAMTHAEPVDVRLSGSEPTPRLSGGSMGDSHPDSLTLQDHVETLADVSALLMDRPPAPAAMASMARPRAQAAPARLAPFLDGPQRPPCAPALIA